MASPSRNHGEGPVGNDVGDVLVDVLREMIANAARLQVQEALRLQEQQAERRLQEVVGQVQQQLQERDEVIGALRHALDERLQRSEARVAALEEAVRSSSQGGGSGPGQQALEARMRKLEEAVQRALTKVFPRVDALVAQLEKPSSTGPSQTAPSTSSTPQPPDASALGAAAAGGEATIDDEQRQRQRVELSIDAARNLMRRAEAEPSFLGESLCRAAFEGKADEIDRLLEAGADVNYMSMHGAPALISIFYVEFDWGCADSHVMSMLLERAANVNAIDVNGCTALHYAVFTGGAEAAAVLLDAGADVNARDEYGATPLHRAAGYSYEACVSTLLAAGARKDLTCWTGPWIYRTPCQVAESCAIQNLLS